MDERNHARQAKDADSSCNEESPTKSSKWSSNSRFNKLLNNIGRSILAEFNGSPSSSSNSNNSSNHRNHNNNSNKQQASNLLGNQSSKTNKTPTKTTTTTTKAIIATKSANKLDFETSQSAQHNVATLTQNHRMDRVTSELHQLKNGGKDLTNMSQPMPANRNGKMILNKYQQQIVSAMQTNKNRPSAATSSYSHNRLSIPPPHANDEARNQNHRLLFGLSPSGAAHQSQSDFNSTISDQMTSTASSIYEQGRNVANKNNTVEQQQLFYHCSASPASSAQSLPVNKPGFSQTSTQNHQKPDDDDDASGFSTYQSRRSAMSGANTLTSTNRISNDFNKPENSTMFLHQTNQMPSVNFTPNISLNNLTPQQQMIHQNLLHSRLTQQQSTNNTQQQQLNQVPITQGVMYNNGANNNNLHNQHQPNPYEQQQNTRPRDSRSQNYGSYGHPGSLQVSMQQQQQRQFQPQPSYDSQIYANAPPKPRRYQYYDPNLNHNPHLMASNRAPQHNYPSPHLIQMMDQQQNIGPPGRQFSYNMPADQAHSYISSSNGTQIPYRPQRQLPMLPPPPATLTKSKSSLDVADMTRFKQDRVHADTILRVQPQSSNVPIYGSTRLINQIESSTLQRNPSYHPLITMNYPQQQQQPQQPLTNLQRSKSIGNLLMPEQNIHELGMTQRQAASFSAHNQQQQSIAPMYSKFLTVSSASTHNLNYIGLANSTTMLLNDNMQDPRQVDRMMQRPTENNVNNSIQKPHHHQHQHQQQQFHALQNAPLPPMRQSHQKPVNVSGGGVCGWPNHPQNKSTAYNNGDGGRIAKTNNVSNSGRIVRQSQNGSNGLSPAEGGSGFVAQSLDDKIRHLLIGSDSTASHARGANNSNSKIEYREVNNVAWPAQQQSQLQISRQTQSSQEKAGTNSSEPVSRVTKALANEHQDKSSQLANNFESNEQLVREQIHQSGATSASMGNRHQRQYQVDGASGEIQDQLRRVSQKNAGNNNCDSMSVNSQLVVDLTTPRVLATTQTTLLPATSLADQLARSPQNSRPQEAWSMNQLGLPTNYSINQFAQLDAQSDISKQPSLNLEVTNKAFGATDVSSFPAPYYYSDLRSEEQRRALLNIVQQKSLSPPPQLLSRSIDQSNTRLAPKSATMHASQARMLSETLVASHRRFQSKPIYQDSKSTNSIPSTTSNSSVAKKIDKLFESPVDPQLGQPITNKLQSVQSMLTLSTDPAGEESFPAMSRISSDQNQIESLSNSSGYCSDAWKRAGSKSKSLENVSQQQSQSNSIDESINKSTIQEKLRRYGNPVYENIRRSDKLLSAINNSTTCLSTSSTRNRKSRICLPLARQQPPTSGSDSMDSILGSSFDDDDDNSDDNPGDIDSDNNSATGIDFIKLSPTTADMSELIEQLKNNHAKLTDEYKSTLTRISKILNRKNSSGKRKISDKLAGRLQRLEHKSKKCESRSKNQLALIQMMEKAIRQTKEDVQKAPVLDVPKEDRSLLLEGDRSPDSSDSKDSTHNSIALKQVSLSCVNTSPCHSIDYQNLEQREPRPISETSSDLNTALPPPPPPPSPPPPVFEAQNVIKAIVTEATSAEIPRKFVAEICRQSKQTEESELRQINSISLSTRHHEQIKNQDRNNKDNNIKPTSNGTVGQRIQSIESIVKRDCRNSSKNRKAENINTPIKSDEADHGQKSPNTFSGLGDDEDDFIEFLTTGGNSTHGRSQFESSQFSASDFNNSSSSGSTSESSHSGSVTTDSLDISRSPPSKSQVEDSKNPSILKSNLKNSKKQEDKSVKKRQNNHNNNNNINNEDTHKIKNRDDRAKGENKFKNVLGNVIDVDVYPPVNMNPQISPVSNK